MPAVGDDRALKIVTLSWSSDESSMRECLLVLPFRVVGLLLDFERYMFTNRIRFVDLFEKVDRDKSGTIDEAELKRFWRIGNLT